MQRKCVKKSVYNAGKGRTNQDFIYLHMSNHYRRILNAKKAIDNSLPQSYKIKKLSTCSLIDTKKEIGKVFESPALTDRSASLNSCRGSFWGTESNMTYSRYHARCIPHDPNFKPEKPEKQTCVDMDLIDRITYDTKNGPAAYCDALWLEVKDDCEKGQQTLCCSKPSKNELIYTSICKQSLPTKTCAPTAQKRKFTAQAKTEPPSTPRAVASKEPVRCTCAEICVCDTEFKKTAVNPKEQSQTSSRDSAYNGGVSSLPESRSPTPDHRPKKDCYCCCCDKRQKNLKCFDSSKTAESCGESPRLTEPISRPPTPKSKVEEPREKDPLKTMKEDALYVKFIQDITVEVLEKNLYTNKALKKVMKKHIKNNLNKLDKERMITEVENLRIQLGIPEDKTLIDFEMNAEGGSTSDVSKFCSVISDSEFVLPKNLTNTPTNKKVAKSVSEEMMLNQEVIAFASETEDEELISVVQVQKVVEDKRKEKRNGNGNGNVHNSNSREHSSDDSDRPSETKKRSKYGKAKQQQLARTSSSSSCSEGYLTRKKFPKKARDEGESSEEISHHRHKRYPQSNEVNVVKKSRSVSFWNTTDPDADRTIEIKRKTMMACSKGSAVIHETRRGKPKND